MNNILNYLNEQESILGIKEVREACRKYMLKKTYAGCEKIKRKAIPRTWTREAYAKQSGICPRCNGWMDMKAVVGDHKQPLAKGGQHNRWNIAALHSRCNLSKGANDFVAESKAKQTGKTNLFQDEP
jgi:5-methylcytosine-specific restriction endonuclease McrA